MIRYFDIPASKETLLIQVKDDSYSAVAKPENIANYFKIKGSIREITLAEYEKLTEQYKSGATE